MRTSFRSMAAVHGGLHERRTHNHRLARRDGTTRNSAGLTGHLFDRRELLPTPTCIYVGCEIRSIFGMHFDRSPGSYVKLAKATIITSTCCIASGNESGLTEDRKMSLEMGFMIGELGVEALEAVNQGGIGSDMDTDMETTFVSRHKTIHVDTSSKISIKCEFEPKSIKTQTRKTSQKQHIQLNNAPEPPPPLD
uniref:Uncharacterized protein n=1 Tax=Panagrellus redivivus TaxID=6233 RepID=A0A7E4V1P0_PANRE